jgi:hypothetical protein
MAERNQTMRDFLKVLPLGLLLPLVLGAASVKPNDAISNIGAWAHTLGLERLSQWLANPAADNRVIAASMGIGAVYAVVVWTIPAINEHRRNPKSERLRTHLLTMAFYCFCAVLVIAIWRFIPSPQIAPPAASLPHPSSALPSPPQPWVSAEEADNARKVGRVLLPFRPDELGGMSYMSGNDSMGAYLGKWVKISTAFRQLSKKTFSDKKDYLLVSIYGIWPATLLFEPKKWEDRLVQLKYNDPLRAQCQLYGFTDAHGPILWNCELN